MRFVVYSRANMIAATPPDTPWALISICEKGDFPEVQENEHLRGRLNLQFHDADRDAGEGHILFDAQMANRIVDFVVAHREKDVDVVYVHCLMGQARSAAVAAALEKALYGDDSKYFGRGPYVPNMLVYRGVLEACFERGLIS